MSVSYNYVALGSSSCLGGESRDDQWLGRSRESRIRRCIWLCPGSPYLGLFSDWEVELTAFCGFYKVKVSGSAVCVCEMGERGKWYCSTQHSSRVEYPEDLAGRAILGFFLNGPPGNSQQEKRRRSSILDIFLRSHPI